MINQPSFLEFFPLLLLAFALLSLWFSKNKGPLLLISTSVLAGLLLGRLHWVGLISLLLAGTFFYSSKKAKQTWVKSVFHLLFILISFMLIGHQMPGFHNFKLFDGVQISSNSLPFTMYLNFDKPFLGFIILYFYGQNWEPIDLKKFSWTILYCFLPCLVVLLSTGSAIGYVTFDPKIPTGAVWWFFNNLIFVCISEEVFFRKYIQGNLNAYLSKNKWGPWVAIFISSLIFGLAHYKGGILYILLSSMAGIFYGLSFHLTKRIEGAILTHFGLNSVHFLFFSYPALS